MSVAVANLTKQYGEQLAVDDLTFEAKKGEILGFLGPNGAGKTTTMKIITTYIPQTGGSVRVCGHDVIEDPMAVRRQIGYLPEHNPLYKEMYVREYLYFIAGVHKVEAPKQRIEEMIHLTGLELEQNKLIGTLSKGYRQRVGLAQAMLHDPAVLILDEPTSGLDPNQLVDIRNLIKQIGAEKTVIFSTHIMQEVQAICDQVLIINRGRLVANDPIDRLQSRLEGEVMVTVEFKQKVDRKRLQGIEGVKTVKPQGNRWQLTSQKDQDIREAIFSFAVTNQLSLLELHKEEASVEEVFRRLTAN